MKMSIVTLTLYLMNTVLVSVGERAVIESVGDFLKRIFAKLNIHDIFLFISDNAS